VRHVLQLNREVGRALAELHQALLRGDSPLPRAVLELVAAYVSGLNSCRYCYGVHAATARAYGVAEELLEALVADLERAPVDPRLRVLLGYLRTLTLSPARLTAADAQAVFAAGWSERELHDAILVACLYNFMNRLLDGHGCTGAPELWAARGKDLAERGYAPLVDALR